MNTDLETQIYSDLKAHLDQVLQQHGDPTKEKWRGLGVFLCLNGFLETALNSKDDDPHSVMKVLDHMFVEMVDLYKQGVSLADYENMLANETSEPSKE